MSALLTHMAMGVLLGLALRWPARWLPLAALLAALPDVDHLDMWVDQPVLRSRATLHNMFFCIALPLAAWAALRWRGADERWQRLAAGAGVLLTSHILLDMLPLDPVGGLGRVALFFPFSSTTWMFPVWEADTLKPWAVTTMTALVVVALAMLGLAALLEQARSARRRHVLAGTSAAVVWLLAFPAAYAGGFVIEKPAWANANIVLEEPFLELPHGRVVVTVYHVGGDDAWGLRVELLQNGTHVSNASAGTGLSPGERISLSFPAGPDPRNLTRTSLRLYGAANHTYAVSPLPLKRSHLELHLNVTTTNATDGPLRITLRNEAERIIPNGSLDVRLVHNGTALANLTVGPSLRPGGNVTVELPRPVLPGTRLEVRARDDGFVYHRIAV